VGLFGSRVHLLTENPDQDAGRAEEVLTQAGFLLAGVRPVEPTLEDVFISVVGRG
jgi:ABC-2 type transport system ATP-binding protein